jgi:hypothetical protein
MAVTNLQALYDMVSFTAVKSFVVQGPRFRTCFYLKY